MSKSNYQCPNCGMYLCEPYCYQCYCDVPEGGKSIGFQIKTKNDLFHEHLESLHSLGEEDYE